MSNMNSRSVSWATLATTIVLTLASQAALAGTAGGRVNVVNVNPTWNGLMVQLDNSTTANFEAACPFSNWAYLPISSSFYPSILAALLAAKASGEYVLVNTSGCVSAPYASVPLIVAVDVGLRNGN